MFSKATHGLGSVQKVRGSVRYKNWVPVSNLRQAVIEWFQAHPDAAVTIKELIDIEKPEGWTEGRLGPLLRSLAQEGILVKTAGLRGGPSLVWSLSPSPSL